MVKAAERGREADAEQLQGKRRMEKESGSLHPTFIPS